MTATLHNPESMQPNHGHVSQEIISIADRYFKAGMEAYDEHVVSEERSKTMYLALLAMGAGNGMAGIDLGHPGTSKSLMVKIGHQIVDGIEENEVARVPHRMDLQPAELVGSSTEVVRTVETEEGSRTEKLSQELKPILTPNSKVVHLDEVTRTSPYALNAALGIIQDGKIAVFDKNGSHAELSTEDIDLIVAASNNHGTAFTNKLDPALIGRFGMGTFTGTRPVEEDKWSDVMEQMVENDERQYGNVAVDGVKKVVKREDLHNIRAAIQGVPLRAAEKDYFKRLNNEMLRKMEQRPWGINMGDGRSVQQLLRVSKALALLGNSEKVTEDHIREASRFFATAKLGLLPGATEAKIDAFVDGLENA